MKNNIELILLLFLWQLLAIPLQSQSKGVLHLQGDQLIGVCEDPYFTGFEIPLDTIYQEIDSLILFQQLP